MEELRSRDVRESPKTNLQSAWREILPIVSQEHQDEVWGLLTGLKPAVAVHNGEAKAIRDILVRLGVAVEMYGDFIVRWSDVEKMISENPAHAAACHMVGLRDQSRFKVACVNKLLSSHDPSGVYAKQSGFVLGYPTSSIKGFDRWLKIGIQRLHENKLVCSPDIFCVSDADWAGWYERDLQFQSSAVKELAERIRFVYKGFASTHPIPPPRANGSNQAALVCDHQNLFLKENKMLVAAFYRELGFSLDDAAFAASCRHVVVSTFETGRAVCRFNTWDYPNESYGTLAADCLQLQEKISREGRKYQDVY